MVGASDKQGGVGNAVLSNLLDKQFAGTVFAVNAKRDSVLGQKAYPTLSAIPSGLDLAIIATPAASVASLIRECGSANIPAALVLSAGFEENGREGQLLAEDLRVAVRESGVRVIGPNCLGIINPHAGLNASFGMSMPKKGTVAVLSQSGALGTAIVDWSVQQNVGLSTFVSLGAMIDVGWAEMIDYLSDDPCTSSIVIYMESIGNARDFLSAARELALYKPVIVLKAGRHVEGAMAAMSHTGAMAGSDDVLDAAFDRCGILRVKTIAELFYMAEVLSKQPRPTGPRLAIVTNAGGPGVLAADALADEGGELAAFAPQTIDELSTVLPPSWSKGNPLDVLGDASAEKYCMAVKCALADPNTDIVLTILTPQAMTNAAEIAASIALISNKNNKPLLASWMGGASVAAGILILQEASIPCFPYPDTAARIAQYMWRYGKSLRNLYETPTLLDDDALVHPDRVRAGNIIEGAIAARRALLTEFESKQLLLAYGIPTVDTILAKNADAAVDEANRLGFPVAVKLNSDIITHKNKVGGVRLNLENEGSVRDAFDQIKAAVSSYDSPLAFQGVTVQRMLRRDGCELILGSKIDAQCGPVLLFGSGGRYAEAIHDFAIGLPPLNSTLANRLMHKARAFRILHEIERTSPDILAQLERIMVIFSRLVLEHREISEIEINPLLVSDEGIIALDARVTLSLGEMRDAVPGAIAQYPVRYSKQWTTQNGHTVRIRPIRPEDEPAMVRFHGQLSDRTVYQRYFSVLGLAQRVAHDRLAKLCFIDYDRQMAMVVEYEDTAVGRREIAGIGRIVRLHRSNDAEFAVVVGDKWQGIGIGTELLRELLSYAEDMGVERVTADVLLDNSMMQHITDKLGFERNYDAETKLVKVSRGTSAHVLTVDMA